MIAVRRIFKDRTWNFYMSMCVAVLAIVAAVALIAADRTDTGALDRTFSLWAFIFVLVGAAVQLISALFDFAALPLFPVIFYAVGTGLHVYTGIPTLTDIFTHVNFYGGNQWAVIVFGALFLLFAVLSAVNCFLEQRK